MYYTQITRNYPVSGLGSPDGLGAYYATNYQSPISAPGRGASTIAHYQPIQGLGVLDDGQKRLAWMAAAGAALLYFGFRKGGFLRTMVRNGAGKAVASYDPRKAGVVAAIKRIYGCRKVTTVKDHGGGCFSGNCLNLSGGGAPLTAGRGTVQLNADGTFSAGCG